MFGILILMSAAGGAECEHGRATASAAAWMSHADATLGYSLRYPASWQRATERMSRITGPWELLTVGTAPLRWQHTDCDAFAGAAASSMGARDVVLTVWERGNSDAAAFPARPPRFGPVADAAPAGPGCGEPRGTVIHWRDFGTAGRRFHTLVRIGPDAAAQDAARAWRVLDSLQLTPRPQSELS